jgi:hypothetical protein
MCRNRLGNQKIRGGEGPKLEEEEEEERNGWETSWLEAKIILY